MQINYLIIDDEPIAHKLIENFAKDISYLHKVGNCHSAIEASPILKQHQIDLIFLDITMPRISGFDFLKSLQHPPKIIVVSAHKEYALESYEYAITDYLLKPFNFERFFKAVQKVVDSLAVTTALDTTTKQQSQALNQIPHIFIKDDKKHHKVALNDIRYIKANGNYTSVYLNEGSILSQMKISDFEKLLPEDKFYRTHRSYIIAAHAITLVKANEIHLGDVVIPVGRVYKEALVGLVG